MKEVAVPVQLSYPTSIDYIIEFVPFEPNILYRYKDHHAATDDEADAYINEVNAFLHKLLSSQKFVDFFVKNNCAISRKQLSLFIESEHLSLIIPDTRQYYCYSEKGFYVLNSSWLYDKRFSPTYHFGYDGISYELTKHQKSYAAYYLNQQASANGNKYEWYSSDESCGLASLICLASKYLVPAFYKFYKDTDGVNSYYLSEYGVCIEDCPGLEAAISSIKDQITKVTLHVSDQTPYDFGYDTLFYTNYEEIRNLIKLNRKEFKQMSEVG